MRRQNMLLLALTVYYCLRYGNKRAVAYVQPTKMKVVGLCFELIDFSSNLKRLFVEDILSFYLQSRILFCASFWLSS
jgi:hypothetical protein